MQSTIESIKKLFWIPENHETGGEPEYIPHLYLQAKIDFSDVRTGFRDSYSINRAVEIPSSRQDLVWDDDEVIDIHPENLTTEAPEGICLAAVPENFDIQAVSWMETQFIQYLFRACTIKVYRNFSLDMYSYPGESRNDFIIRCLETSMVAMHSEFDTLLGVFERKLERLRFKYIGTENSEDSGELEKYKTNTDNRKHFHWITERISALFLRTEFSIQRVHKPTGNVPYMHEFEERLQALHYEAQQAVTRILDSYEEKAKFVDEYILHPTMKDIHFVNSCILWMPNSL